MEAWTGRKYFEFILEMIIHESYRPGGKERLWGMNELAWLMVSMGYAAKQEIDYLIAVRAVL